MLTDLYTVSLVLQPASTFLRANQFDKARSYVNYYLDQLGLQKNATTVIQNSIEFVDDPELIEAALGPASTLSNTAVQLDGTIYMLVFIPPADDGTQPPDAVKYVKEAEVFNATFYTDVEKLLALGSDGQRVTAQTAAAERVKTLLPKLFN